MNNPLKKIELNNKKALLAVITALVIVYLDCSFVIKLQIQNLNRVTPGIQKLKEDINALSAQLAKMRGEKTKLVQAKEQAFSKSKKFITEEEVPSLLEEISETAKENDIELIQMKPSREKAAGVSPKDAAALKFTPFSISMSLSCGYHQLGRFLNSLENKNIFIAVQDMDISSRQKDYFKHKVELTLRVYAEKKL